MKCPNCGHEFEQGSGAGKAVVEKVRYLNARQVAERYGLTVNWVHHCKGLKAIRRKVGKYLYYREDDLERFERERPERGVLPLTSMRKFQEELARKRFEERAKVWLMGL